MTTDELTAAAAASGFETREIEGVDYFSLHDLNELIETPAATEISATRIRELTDPLSTTQAAELTGLTDSYLRRVCKSKNGAPPALKASRIKRRDKLGRDQMVWSIEPGDLADFLQSRQPPTTRACFDVTFTMEKSVSLLALLSEPDVRKSVIQAVLTANSVGIDHLNFNASNARVKGEVVPTAGLSVASYVHTTSRADDPFVHVHNIVLNAVRTADKKDRALNAQNLYRQAAVAGHLATAQLRHELTSRFGVRWVAQPGSSVFEIDGMTPAQIATFSKRRSEIESALRELQLLDTAEMRPAADRVNRATREAKTGLAADDIRLRWEQEAAAVGLTPDRLKEICVGAVEPPPLSNEELVELLEYLCSPDGATQNHSVFTEADAASAVLRWVPEGRKDARVMSAADMSQAITRFFDSAQVVPLADPSDPSPSFTTRRCVKVQAAIERLWETGVGAVAPIDPEIVAEVLDQRPTMSVEQRGLVQAWCLSGDRAQSAIGRPGTGKTFTCSAAVEVFQKAGFKVIGAAVKGEAARLLGAEAGVPSETVAMRLAQIRSGALQLTTRTVLLVDEASTISDDDLGELLAAVTAADATLRCVGDPAQHSSVPAGGMWEHLTTRYAVNTPELTATRRMVNQSDIDAAEHARRGEIEQALTTLDSAGQLSVYDSDAEMHAALLARWRRLRASDRAAPLVVGDNHTRTVLNAACQQLRLSQGEITEPRPYGPLSFGVGDEVISRRTDRKIMSQQGDYIRNGTTGVVVAVTDNHVVVDFESVGEITLPARWVADDHLNLAYALTSYAVQGATQPVSTSVLSTGANQAELVVNITRGRRDNHLAVIRRNNSEMSHLHQHEAHDIAAAVASTVRSSDNTPAIITDPTLIERSDPSMSLAAIDDARTQRLLAPNEHSVFSRRRLTKIALHAKRNPDDILGKQPNSPAFAWIGDLHRKAAVAVSTYRDRHSPNRTTLSDAPYAGLLGDEPEPGPQHDTYLDLVDQLNEAFDALNMSDPSEHTDSHDYYPPIPDWTDGLTREHDTHEIHF